MAHRTAAARAATLARWVHAERRLGVAWYHHRALAAASLPETQTAAAHGSPGAARGSVGLAIVAGGAAGTVTAPFADDLAALVIVVKVTPSMKTEDVQPDRLTRTVQKIHDLLALRSGARSALIAYAGTSHLVVPLTRDAGIVNTFAAALNPKIMPDDGDAAVEALALADQVLAKFASLAAIWDGLAVLSVCSSGYLRECFWRKIQPKSGRISR